MRARSLLIVFRALFFSVLLVVVNPYEAATAELDARQNGPKIGASVGSLFGVTDQDGNIRTFKSLIGKNGLIILFSHSFDW